MSYPSISENKLTLSQCLENLRHASILVLQHEQVSDEAKSFLGELIGAILERANQADSPANGFGVPIEQRGEQHRPHHFGSHSDSLVRSSQVGVDSASELILVSNPSTGKTLTCSAEDLIAWAKQHRHADL